MVRYIVSCNYFCDSRTLIILYLLSRNCFYSNTVMIYIYIYIYILLAAIRLRAVQLLYYILLTATGLTAMALLRYIFTHKQYTEHNETAYLERNIYNNRNT